MIEKFNFYDVYGYFLPGLAFIAVLWLPFGLVAHIWPKGDWGSAVVAIALAYFIGHFMLYVSTNVIPSIDVKKSTPDKERHPSETVLDENSTDMQKEIREKIGEAIRLEFQWEVHVDNSTGEYDGVRKSAFSLARQRLILENAEGYAEQFEGMYSLARGLVVALSVGTAFYSGWCFSKIHQPCLLLAALVIGFVILLALVILAFAISRDPKQKKQLERYFGKMFLSMFFPAGIAFGFCYQLTTGNCLSLAFAAALALVLSFRCYVQYRYFSIRFATTIWRDFAVFALRQPPAR